LPKIASFGIVNSVSSTNQNARVNQIVAQLKRRTIHVKEDWVRQCLSYLANFHDINDKSLIDLVVQQFLVSDLTQIGVSRLPPNIVGMHNEILPGPFVLQINELFNISDALENRYEDTKHRMLKLCFTDGGQMAYALEYRHIPALSVVKTHPGTKIILSNVQVKRGLLMLKPENIQILGGGVQDLINKHLQIRKQSVKNLLPQEWMDELCEQQVDPNAPDLNTDTQTNPDPDPDDDFDFDVGESEVDMGLPDDYFDQ